MTDEELKTLPAGARGAPVASAPHAHKFLPHIDGGAEIQYECRTMTPLPPKLNRISSKKDHRA